MNKIIKAMAVTGVALMSVSSVVMAAPLGNDGSTLVSLKAKPGALTQQAPLDVSLGEITVSSQIVPVTGTALDYRVDDARGKKNPVGWSAVVTMSALSGQSPVDVDGDGTIEPGETETVKIPFIDTVANNNVYTLTPVNFKEHNSNPESLSALTPGTETELTEVDATGVSSAVTVMTGMGSLSQGQFGADVDIDIDVPANSVEADYTSTLTFTVS